MHRHMCDCTKPLEEFHTNAFINVDGIPYLLADYLDRRNFQQIDRSMINSLIETDQSEAMRAIIDINVDDIGKRSDGTLGVIGNNTKQVNLLEMINRNFSRLRNRLPVLRKGLVLRINYRLENHRTGQTIKSMSEDFRIGNANYFLDINSRNINDNAIVVNFSGSSVSTINHFTHGRDKMILRITNVDMFYECVKNGPSRPVGKEYLVGGYDNPLPSIYGDEDSMYDYHKPILDNNMPYNHRYGNEPVEMITPPAWILFDHFYHFDNNGKDIIIHNDEVYNRNAKTALIPCGSIIINRAIIINPCHRIIFKFCVWKNDTTLVNDTTMIASALRASVRNPYYDNSSEIYPTNGIINCGGYEDYKNNPCRPPIVPDYEALLRMYQNGQSMDYDQNAVINQLSSLVGELTSAINDIKGTGSNEEDDKSPEIPTLPEAPAEKPCKPSHHDPMKVMMDMIKSLQDQINDLKKGDGDNSDPENPDLNPDDPSSENCNCGGTGGNYKPMQPDDIKDAVNSAVDETDPDKKLEE